MIKRIHAHPDLELVGLHCYSPDKVGRDAGEIAGIDPIGVIATGTVEEILAAKPDCVTFHGVFPDVDLYERVLEAGIDIVTTADWITGHHRNANHPHRSGRTEAEVIAGRVPARRVDVLRHRHEPRPGADPDDRALLPTSPTSSTSPASSRSTCRATTPSTPGSNCGFGRPVDDPGVPRHARAGHPGVRGRRAADGRLPRHRARRGRRSSTSSAPAPRTSTSAGTSCPTDRSAAAPSSTSGAPVACPASSCTSSGR